MKGVNVEIKARCGDPDRVRRVLMARKAEFRGADRQVDTYFNVPRGRLKLREGEIENGLIYYERKDRKGPRTRKLRAQCREWAKTLGIADEDLVSGSYAEMTAQEIRG